MTKSKFYIRLKTNIPNIIFWIWIISILWVSYLSLQPSIKTEKHFENQDKVLHLIVYIWISLLAFLSFVKDNKSSYAALFVLLLSLILEIGQYYIPGRFFSIGDILANSAGVFIGYYLGTKIRIRFSDLFLI